MHGVRKTILVIDDDPDTIALVESALSDSFDCETAYTASDGLQKAITLKPDLILLDLMLPEMSGFGVMRNLRRKLGRHGIPVVVLTSLVDEEIADEAMGLGAVGYLSKACKAKELISMVQEYI
ncbi:MAG: response regulator [Deltaproteobacteria bacterium]|nr:response regulator [Deltaproteobacteria bacterium]